MTAHQYNRLKRWKKRCRSEYRSGIEAGKQRRHNGGARPNDRLEYDYALHLNPRKRNQQDAENRVTAAAIGLVDGWELADKDIRDSDLEEAVQTALADGFDEVERFANWGVA